MKNVYVKFPSSCSKGSLVWDAYDYGYGHYVFHGWDKFIEHMDFRPSSVIIFVGDEMLVAYDDGDTFCYHVVDE